MPLFIYPPTPLIINNPELNSSGTGTLTANTTYVQEVVVPVGVTATSLRWKMGSTATGTTDIGIYDSGGTQLTHTGASTNTASNNMNVAITSLTLGPGKYYIALTPSNSTDTYSRATSLSANAANPIGPYFTAANTGTAGVLPATLGTLSTANSIPIMAIAISGGI